MHPSSLADSPSLPPRWLRVAITSVLFVWAAFWTWFLVASAIGEWGEGGAGHVAMFAVLAALLLAVWRKPLWGGAALAVLGALALAFFPHPFARAISAAPMVAFGGYYAWLGWQERRR